MRNLAPQIHRQRVIIEGWTIYRPTKEELEPYLTQLSRVMEMRVIDIALSDSPYGPAAMCHWDFSGVAVMVWYMNHGGSFISVDLHSCKPFSYETPVELTESYLKLDPMSWGVVMPELAVGTTLTEGDRARALWAALPGGVPRPRLSTWPLSLPTSPRSSGAGPVPSAQAGPCTGSSTPTWRWPSGRPGLRGPMASR